MATEIERKFLVTGEYKSKSCKSYDIQQGYIARCSGKTVRVRIRDGQGFLTIKGPSHDGGLSRFEWEIEIPSEDAENLLMLCDKKIDKTRHIVEYKSHTFEVDEFYGDNEGLTMAEVELSDPKEIFARPEWLGEELTGDKRFYNSHLAMHPFKEWRDTID